MGKKTRYERGYTRVKREWPRIFLMMAIYAITTCACGAETDTATTDKPSYFKYDESNPPAVFFFPPEKARWDGSRITIREWYMLTDYQKQKFINEYLDEMRRNYSSPIDVISMDYLRALNIFSTFSSEKASAEPTARVIDKLLAGQGKVSPKSDGSVVHK